MNVNHLYFLFEKNMMKTLEHSGPYIFVKTPLYFLFYFFETPEIFPYKTPDLEYVNFATPCILIAEMIKFTIAYCFSVNRSR
jgi:hypothetical protein